jgi:hypothetical protein
LAATARASSGYLEDSQNELALARVEAAVLKVMGAPQLAAEAVLGPFEEARVLEFQAEVAVQTEHGVTEKPTAECAVIGQPSVKCEVTAGCGASSEREVSFEIAKVHVV